jgi:hypothetical protein
MQLVAIYNSKRNGIPEEDNIMKIFIMKLLTSYVIPSIASPEDVALNTKQHLNSETMSYMIPRPRVRRWL